MKKYQHLFFDLDGTLWDLYRNTHITLVELFKQYEDELNDIDFQYFFKRYHYHNDKAWSLYREGKMDKETLRVHRFAEAFKDVGGDKKEAFVSEFASGFIEIAPKQIHAMPGAVQLLEHCSKKYSLHILTNGFLEVQHIKMKAAHLTGYFIEVINGEECGAKKPDPKIFKYTMERTGAQKENSLMIGDDWYADILGARDFGIDQVYLTTTEEWLSDITGNPIPRHNYKPDITRYEN